MNITDEDIRQFLPRAKITEDEISGYRSSKLESTEQKLVLAELSVYFTTDGWISDPPPVVKSLIIMRVAANLYNQHFSEDDADVPGYGRWLWGRANNLMRAIIDGTIKIVDDQDIPGGASVEELPEPAFSMGDVW